VALGRIETPWGISYPFIDIQGYSGVKIFSSGHGWAVEKEFWQRMWTLHKDVPEYATFIAARILGKE
jgi:hypothetical protein